MSQDQDRTEIKDEDPSRRNFLKVSMVAGATVAALAAGAGAIPKLASRAATASSTSAASVGSVSQAESATASAKEPLILVLNGDSVDAYQGESKFPIKDSVLAREIASRVGERIR